ncbi:unnamed protein product, partial [Protopolystoma xenopodis]
MSKLIVSSTEHPSLVDVEYLRKLAGVTLPLSSDSIQATPISCDSSDPNGQPIQVTNILHCLTTSTSASLSSEFSTPAHASSGLTLEQQSGNSEQLEETSFTCTTTTELEARRFTKMEQTEAGSIDLEVAADFSAVSDGSFDCASVKHVDGGSAGLKPSLSSANIRLISDTSKPERVICSPICNYLASSHVISLGQHTLMLPTTVTAVATAPPISVSSNFSLAELTGHIRCQLQSRVRRGRPRANTRLLRLQEDMNASTAATSLSITLPGTIIVTKAASISVAPWNQSSGKPLAMMLGG